MTLPIFVTLAVICIVVYMMSFTRIHTDVAYLIALVMLSAGGVLSVGESFSGFVSNASLTLIFLAIIVTAVRRTGGMKLVTKIVCGKKDTPLRRLLMRVTSIAATMSMFVNDSAVATLLYADVAKWAREHGLNPSKIILPVAYAIGIGGACTLIGSSSNLIIMDIYADMTGGTVHFFEPMLVAFPCLVVCLLVMFLLTGRAPENAGALRDVSDTHGQMVLEMLVPADSPFVGEMIDGLEDFRRDDIRLVKLCRFDNEKLSPIPEGECLLGGDRLVLYGNYSKLLALRDRMGFVCSNDFVLDSKRYRNQRRTIQHAIVPSKSMLADCRIIDTDFESRHGVTLLALTRNGEMLEDSPRETVILSGDMLTFEGQALAWDSLHLDLLPYGDTVEFEQESKKWVAIGILAVVIIGSAMGLFSLSLGACVAVLALGACRCISHKQAWSSIQWGQVAMIAGSKAIGTAVAASGLAALASDAISTLCGGRGVILPLAVIIGLTVLLVQVVAAPAIIAILVPIGITLAVNAGADPMPFAIGVMLGACCTFMTSFTKGHIAQAMPHGCYRPKDLIRYGWPLTLVMYATIVVLCTLIYLL